MLACWETDSEVTGALAVAVVIALTTELRTFCWRTRLASSTEQAAPCQLASQLHSARQSPTLMVQWDTLRRQVPCPLQSEGQRFSGQGHSSTLHGCSSTAIPRSEQSFPPLLGAGAVHVRTRDLTPRKKPPLSSGQLAVQFDHLLHIV